MGWLDWGRRAWNGLKILGGGIAHLFKGVTKTAGILKPLGVAAHITNQILHGGQGHEFGDSSEDLQWGMYGT